MSLQCRWYGAPSRFGWDVWNAAEGPACTHWAHNWEPPLGRIDDRRDQQLPDCLAVGDMTVLHNRFGSSDTRSNPPVRRLRRPDLAARQRWWGHLLSVLLSASIGQRAEVGRYSRKFGHECMRFASAVCGAWNCMVYTAVSERSQRNR